MNTQNFYIIVDKTKKDVANLKDKKLKDDLEAISGNVTAGLERDLEEVKIDNKYKLDFEGNVLSESINENFDYDIFKKIGLITIDDGKLKLGEKIDTDEYLLYKLNDDNKVKLIESYFQVETLRYCNQKIHSYLFRKKRIYNVLHYLSNFITIALSLITYANNNLKIIDTYANTISGIVVPALIFINFGIHHALVLANVNNSSYTNLQKQITKIRFMLETIMLGTHPNNTDEDVSDILSKVQTDIKDLNYTHEISNNKVINDLFSKSLNTIKSVNDNILKELSDKILLVKSLNELKNMVVLNDNTN